MRSVKFIIFAFLLFFHPSYSQNQIELVESVPVETNLDNSDIRNTQEVWLEMINGAKKTLDIEEFYISNQKGEALDTVINAIVSAGERGVKVRVIVDAGMYKTYPETVDQLGKQKNVEARTIDFKKLAGGIQHSKYFIVDSDQVFLGSQNFDWRSLTHIHEIGVRLNAGDERLVYMNLFQSDWDYAKDNSGEWVNHSFTISKNYPFYKDPVYGSGQLYPCTSPNDLSQYNGYTDLNEILQIISSAKSEVTLQFLSYYSKDWGVMDSVLINAANRGVRVKMIISDWNLSKDAVETFLKLQENPNIEIRYTEIPEWSGGYIPFARVEHCKYITGDRKQCWIGTSNMAKSYFYNSRNVGVVVENKKFTTRLKDIFYKSWNGPYANKIEPDGNYQIRFHLEKN